MKEIVLNKKQNGLAMMLFWMLIYGAGIALIVFSAIGMSAAEDINENPSAGTIIMFVCGLLWAILGWIPFLGLKVLKPQEALVLTLFGKYIGTLKSDGFY